MEEDETTGAIEAPGETAEPDFDRLAGVLTDGVVGVASGLVGTSVIVTVLVAADSMGIFDMARMTESVRLAGVEALFPGVGSALPLLAFVGIGVVVWPLLLASIGRYLPGERFATKGAVFGTVLWTGFAVAFYGGYAGTALLLYLAVTLVGHVAYGVSVGAVLDYLGGRPETLV